MEYKYLFGPVPSRRLGISLGVDLVPLKVCSMNCLYCESGRTTNLTTERKDYVPFEGIKEELTQYLSTNPKLDYITFSGAGEPTLHCKIGELISFIKDNFPTYKLALITNSTFLSDKNFREQLSRIDLLVPSLDAVTEKSFLAINRPNSNLKIDEIIKGLIELKQETNIKIWLEIFFIIEVNDSLEELTKFKEVIKQINPEKVQLNSLDRPGTEKWVQPMPLERLMEIAEFFEPLNVEIIAKSKANKFMEIAKTDIESAILGAIRRRPCTIEDLTLFLGQDISEIEKSINKLEASDKIVKEKRERGFFYLLKN